MPAGAAASRRAARRRGPSRPDAGGRRRSAGPPRSRPRGVPRARRTPDAQPAQRGRPSDRRRRTPRSDRTSWRSQPATCRRPALLASPPRSGPRAGRRAWGHRSGRSYRSRWPGHRCQAGPGGWSSRAARGGLATRPRWASPPLRVLPPLQASPPRRGRPATRAGPGQLSPNPPAPDSERGAWPAPPAATRNPSWRAGSPPASCQGGTRARGGAVPGTPEPNLVGPGRRATSAPGEMVPRQPARAGSPTGPWPDGSAPDHWTGPGTSKERTPRARTPCGRAGKSGALAPRPWPRSQVPNLRPASRAGPPRPGEPSEPRHRDQYRPPRRHDRQRAPRRAGPGYLRRRPASRAGQRPAGPRGSQRTGPGGSGRVSRGGWGRGGRPRRPVQGPWVGQAAGPPGWRTRGGATPARPPATHRTQPVWMPRRGGSDPRGTRATCPAWRRPPTRACARARADASRRPAHPGRAGRRRPGPPPVCPARPSTAPDV